MQSHFRLSRIANDVICCSKPLRPAVHNICCPTYPHLRRRLIDTFGTSLKRVYCGYHTRCQASESSLGGSGSVRLSIYPTGNNSASSKLNLPKIREVELQENTTIILLITPSFAGLIGRSSKFVDSELLPWLFGNVKQGKVSLLTAVIDKIPRPRRRHLEAGARQFRARTLGLEGLSVHVTDTNVISRLIPLRKSSESRVKNLDNRFGTLTFEVQHAITSAPVYDEALTGQSVSQRSRFGIHLANTTFVNGSHHTLFLQQWSLLDDGTGNKNWVRISDEGLSHAHLALQPAHSYDDVDPVEFSDTYPLTPFRKVKSSAGNVLSAFENESDSDRPIPVSEELERHLPQILQTLQPRAYEVWAHVIPRAIWSNVPTIRFSHSKAGYICFGHRFYRVIGGGGGWGTKQGLIALDPPSNLWTETEREIEFKEIDQPFQNIVESGDAVRFFLLPAQPQNLYQGPDKPRSHIQRLDDVYLFGSMEIGAGDVEIARNSSTIQTSNVVSVTEGLFGGISRRNLDIIVELVTDSEVSNVGVLPIGQVAQTKLPSQSLLFF